MLLEDPNGCKCLIENNFGVMFASYEVFSGYSFILEEEKLKGFFFCEKVTGRALKSQIIYVSKFFDKLIKSTLEYQTGFLRCCNYKRFLGR